MSRVLTTRAAVPSLAEAACLSWVRGVPPSELLERLGASGPHARRKLADLAFEEDAALAQVDDDAWDNAVFEWIARRIGAATPLVWFEAEHPSYALSRDQ